MTLSREARIILAILAVAVAAFVWVNYYSRSGQFGSVLPTPQGRSTPRGPSAEFAPLPIPTAGDQAAAGAPTAAVPVTAPITARDIEIAELPFLVTAPPAHTADAAGASGQPGPSEAAAPAETGTRRVSINPFSPIIVARASTPPAERAPRVRVVDIPVQPRSGAAFGPSVRAPAPAPSLPGSSAPGLPRPLPGGTLPVATDILRSARTGVAASNRDLAELAAVTVPDGVSPSALAEAASENSPDGTALQVLNPRAGTNAPAIDAPLVAGTSALSRYLRDNNVVFTGSVLGPISVGVFRSSLSASPVVVALGQPIPDTPIILTSLKGQQAVLTQGSQSQTLILDLRR